MAMPPDAHDRAKSIGSPLAAVTPFDGSTRARIMVALAHVLTHGGYREASVDRVLEQAHVGWPAFIEEFEDLDACLLATLDASFESAAAVAERAMLAAPAGDGAAIFEAGLRALLETIAAAPELAALCFDESAALGARAVARKEVGLQRFVGLLRERPISDGAGATLPKLAAEMVVGGIHEVIQRKVRARETSELPLLATELQQLWLPIIRSGPAQIPDA